VVTRGGIRFGPGVCGAGGPEASPGCTREDTGAAHADGLHSDRLGKYGGAEWPVTAEERDRWVWLARPRPGPHPCRTPNARATAFSLSLLGEDPEDAPPWVCPECLQHWDLEVSRCGECLRPEGAPEWVRRREWAGQDTSLADALLRAMTPRTDKEGLVVLGTTGGGRPSAPVSAGGWCAPTETLYRTDEEDEG
jgi:hypothetical protein